MKVYRPTGNARRSIQTLAGLNLPEETDLAILLRKDPQTEEVAAGSNGS